MTTPRNPVGFRSKNQAQLYEGKSMPSSRKKSGIVETITENSGDINVYKKDPITGYVGFKDSIEWEQTTSSPIQEEVEVIEPVSTPSPYLLPIILKNEDIIPSYIENPYKITRLNTTIEQHPEEKSWTKEELTNTYMTGKVKYNVKKVTGSLMNRFDPEGPPDRIELRGIGQYENLIRNF